MSKSMLSSDGHRRVTTIAAGLALAALLAMVVVLWAARSAEAAFPGANGKIAFVKENLRQGSSGIFTMNPDGSEQIKIGSGYSPSYSADGQKVVFERLTGEGDVVFDQDIFVMDADGSDVRQITGEETSDEAYDYSPSFSPDGNTIAFTRDTYEQATDTFTVDIFTVDIASGDVTDLTNTPNAYEDSAAFSPDGSQIVFSRYKKSSSDIYVMNAADGSDQKPLTSTRRTYEYDPNWSPDGSRIVFTSYRGGNEEISVMNSSDGTQRNNLTESSAFEGSPAFSPNGKRIVFSRYSFSKATGEKSDIFVMRQDGTGVKKLTDTRAFEWGLDWQPIAP